MKAPGFLVVMIIITLPVLFLWRTVKTWFLGMLESIEYDKLEKREKEAEFKREFNISEDELKKRFEQKDFDESVQQENVERSPCEVLGVSEQATIDEIRKAFKKKALENHPDRTAGLGEEYKQLAEKRMKEINRAYEQLRKDNN